MNKDCICVDDSYPIETLKFWKEHGVVYPKQNQFCTINNLIKYPNGMIGVQLEGLENPKIPVNKFGNDFMMEVSFALRRFRSLKGDIITAKELENINVNV